MIECKLLGCLRGVHAALRCVLHSDCLTVDQTSCVRQDLCTLSIYTVHAQHRTQHDSVMARLLGCYEAGARHSELLALPCDASNWTRSV